MASLTKMTALIKICTYEVLNHFNELMNKWKEINWKATWLTGERECQKALKEHLSLWLRQCFTYKFAASVVSLEQPLYIYEIILVSSIRMFNIVKDETLKQ